VHAMWGSLKGDPLKQAWAWYLCTQCEGVWKEIRQSKRVRDICARRVRESERRFVTAACAWYLCTHCEGVWKENRHGSVCVIFVHAMSGSLKGDSSRQRVRDICSSNIRESESRSIKASVCVIFVQAISESLKVDLSKQACAWYLFTQCQGVWK